MTFGEAIGKLLPKLRRLSGKYIDLNKEYNQPSSPSKDPRVPANYGGVSLEFFRPVKCPADNVNNHSIVTVMTYSGVKFLLPGDNEPPSWCELLRDRQFVQAIEGTHVLVAPHHGRRSGYHGPLFEHISPLLTIISDGRYVDTSATGRYSAVTKGWDGQQTKRWTGNTLLRHNAKRWRDRHCGDAGYLQHKADSVGDHQLTD